MLGLEEYGVVGSTINISNKQVFILPFYTLFLYNLLFIQGDGDAHRYMTMCSHIEASRTYERAAIALWCRRDEFCSCYAVFCLVDRSCHYSLGRVLMAAAKSVERAAYNDVACSDSKNSHKITCETFEKHAPQLGLLWYRVA